jgi:hypothetical protein
MDGVELPQSMMDLCSFCDREFTFRDSVQCYYCKGWCHFKWVGIPVEEQKSWSVSNLRFACKNCAFTGNEFDASAALVR